MSYKTKAVGEYRGGAVTVKEPIKPRRFPCFATDCPMAGTLFPGAGVGGTGDAPGTCAWHFGVNSADIPKVTRVLLDWQCVAFEIREARRALAGELATNPHALGQLFATAWERLQPIVTGWEAQLAPGNIHSSKGVDRGIREGYADWAKRLERFLGARVVEVLSVHHRRAA